MISNQSVKSKSTQIFCSKCRKKIRIGNEYHYNAKVLCEDCCIDLRTPRARKTHWQYISSIKDDYLRPGKKFG
jgi:hypothetical protein